MCQNENFDTAPFKTMSIFSPQRKVRSSYNLLKDFEYYLPDIKGMFILLLLLLAGALIGNFVVLAFSAIPGAEGLADEYSLLLSYPVMFIPAMIYAVNKSRFNQGFDMEEAVPLDRNNFGKTGFAALALMSVVVTLAAGFITDPISKLLPPTPEWFERLNEKMLTGTPLVITLISVSVFAPLFEEWLCRGLVLRGLLTRMKPLWAMVISSAFFAVIHMNPWQALPAFLLGMLFAYVYYRTASLKLTMLMHCTNNTFAALLGQNETFREMSSYSELLSGWQYGVAVAAAVFIVAVFVMILARNVSPAAFEEIRGEGK